MGQIVKIEPEKMTPEKKKKEFKKLLNFLLRTVVKIKFKKKNGEDRILISTLNKNIVRIFWKRKNRKNMSQSSIQALETRKSNNPRFISVIDMEQIGDGDDDFWRGFNFNQVYEYKVLGKYY